MATATHANPANPATPKRRLYADVVVPPHRRKTYVPLDNDSIRNAVERYTWSEHELEENAWTAWCNGRNWLPVELPGGAEAVLARYGPIEERDVSHVCLLYTSPSPRDS